jgi:hypothetical protein
VGPPPLTGPCAVWTNVEAVIGCKPCAGVDLDADDVAEAIEVASELLYVWSGRQFPGECTSTVEACVYRPDLYPPGNQSVDHASHRWGACVCGNSVVCKCLGGSRLDLGVYPVTDIISVLIDSAVLPTTDYDVVMWRTLVRLDGEVWPTDQDIEVNFRHGLAPPKSGVRAAKTLACELVLSCAPDGEGACRLPKRVQSVTRQGMSMVLLDPFEFLDKGRTGVPEIDYFIQAYNPNGLSESAVVASPDVPPPSVIRTWTEAS